MKRIAIILSILLIGFSCTEPEKNQPTIVVTTNILGDAVERLLNGIDSVEIAVLMGPGVDPHLYKASQGDIEKLARADLIVYNGLHLEGKMTDIFAKLRNKQSFSAGAQIDTNRLINASEYASSYDPHIWFDPVIWSDVIKALAQQLKTQFPKWRSSINKNETKLLDDIAILHQNNILKIDNIPESQRVLITAHDAFKYFGRTYNMEVRGLQGISTAAEYGIRDVSRLVDFIVENKIKAIFVESSVPKRSIEAVIQGAKKSGHQVKLGGQLYSDALGGENSNATTYISMFEKNVETIVYSLR